MKTDRSLYFSRIVKKKSVKFLFLFLVSKSWEILQDHMKSIWFNNVSKCVQAKNKIKSKFCSLLVAEFDAIGYKQTILRKQLTHTITICTYYCTRLLNIKTKHHNAYK